MINYGKDYRIRYGVSHMLLYAKGLTYYDEWELFKANGGRNANDYCSIELREVKELEG